MLLILSVIVSLSGFIPGVESIIDQYFISDALGLGRRFDGIGGLSGGGATSKLLVNYPEQQRNEILDYLFKPNYGASLHILKVEIGGDSQSTDGTESSHMHESWDENYQRGYEWWLMVEAKKRNPDILLYSLPWAFPGWIGSGTFSPYTTPNKTADYVVRWIAGAKRYYNLTMDYVGIWNERPYDVTYIKTLRRTLDARGFQHVKIVAADGEWEIAEDILADSDLAESIVSIGVHYPGTQSTYHALRTEKQLWASEDYSTFNDNTGAGCWARLLNQNYVNGLMTSTISWNLIASYYYNLPFYRNGLMTAIEPWSGNYVIEAPIWVSAHTTQFASPGWKYLKHSSGVGKLAQGGSFVTLTNPKSTDSITIVIESMSHDHSICIRPPLPKYTVQPQTAIFKLEGSFAAIQSLNVWYTKLGFDGNPSTLFQKSSPVQVVNGMVTLQIGVDEIWTLTTLTSGVKGTAPSPPAPQLFPLPYSDDFESYTQMGTEPYNLAQQIGVWEVANVGAPHNNIIRQVVLEEPVSWCAAEKSNRTFSIIGQQNWTDIFVRADVRVGSVNGSQGVFVGARINQGGCGGGDTKGFFFTIYPKGVANLYFELTNDLKGDTVLVAGDTETLQSDWNRISLTIMEGRLSAAIDSIPVLNIPTPETPAAGFVGIGTVSYGIAEFDNFEILRASEGAKLMRPRVQEYDPDTLYFKPQSKDQYSKP